MKEEIFFSNTVIWPMVHWSWKPVCYQWSMLIPVWFYFLVFQLIQARQEKIIIWISRGEICAALINRDLKCQIILSQVTFQQIKIEVIPSLSHRVRSKIVAKVDVLAPPPSYLAWTKEVKVCDIYRNHVTSKFKHKF